MHALDEEGASFGAAALYKSIFRTQIMHREKILFGRMHNILSTYTSSCVCCVYHWDLLFPSVCQDLGLPCPVPLGAPHGSCCSQFICEIQADFILFYFYISGA